LEVAAEGTVEMVVPVASEVAQERAAARVAATVEEAGAAEMGVMIMVVNHVSLHCQSSECLPPAQRSSRPLKYF
jgi:hypothetical protein